MPVPPTTETSDAPAAVQTVTAQVAAAAELARARAALEAARTTYLDAEHAYEMARRTESPIIGFLESHAHVAVARKVAKALGRDLVADFHPRVEWRVTPTEAGAERIARTKAAACAARDAMNAALQAVEQAARAHTEALSDEERRALVEREVTMLEDVDAVLAADEAEREAMWETQATQVAA